MFKSKNRSTIKPLKLGQSPVKRGPTRTNSLAKTHNWVYVLLIFLLLSGLGVAIYFVVIKENYINYIDSKRVIEGLEYEKKDYDKIVTQMFEQNK